MALQKTFFSYSRVDSEFVLKLAKDLRAAGADIWLDQLDISAGKRWDAEIEQALESAQVQLVILSPTSVGSNNVMDEVSYALEKGKHVIPILLIECQIPFRLKRLQYINFTGNYEAGFDQLLKALNLVKIGEKENVSQLHVNSESEKSSDGKSSIEEEQKQKLDKGVEQKQNEPIRQETIIKSPINNNVSASNSVIKKSPVKLIVAVAAVVIVVLAILFITNLGSDENSTSITADSLSTDTETLTNNSIDNNETVEEEPVHQVVNSSEYYEFDNGSFHREGNKWKESGRESNSPNFTFEETSRDSNYIYLYDASRGMTLALPVGEGYCLLLNNTESGDTEWRELYYLRIPK